MYRNIPINQHRKFPGRRVRLYLADAVIDAAGIASAPGAVVLHNGRVVAAGDVAKVRQAARDLAASPPLLDLHELPGRLLLPGLVNAHVHLDLTHIGPVPYIGNFNRWVQFVMRARPVQPGAIAAAVREGARLSRAAGVLRVGDIAGSAHAYNAAREADLAGVSFRELFGSPQGPLPGDQPADNPTDPRTTPPLRLGLQPHAPYSAQPDLYALAARTAARRQMPLSTHLAETPHEAAFTSAAAGPFRQLLRELGKWDDRLLPLYSDGLHPVQWLEQAITPHETALDRSGNERSAPGGPQAAKSGDAGGAAGPNGGGRGVEEAEAVGAAGGVGGWLCAHCNYVEDEHIATLARRGWSVAYCPRASDYFGHRGHRYRDMLRAGVNVCLGTDSIICHGSLSIFDEMRHLHRRDHADPLLLLKMATVNGMKALGLDPADATFTPGAAAGLIAVGYDTPPRGRPTQSPPPAGEPGDAVALLRAMLAAPRPPTITTLADLGDGGDG